MPGRQMLFCYIGAAESMRMLLTHGVTIASGRIEFDVLEKSGILHPRGFFSEVCCWCMLLPEHRSNVLLFINQ